MSEATRIHAELLEEISRTPQHLRERIQTLDLDLSYARNGFGTMNSEGRFRNDSVDACKGLVYSLPSLSFLKIVFPPGSSRDRRHRAPQMAHGYAQAIQHLGQLTKLHLHYVPDIETFFKCDMSRPIRYGGVAIPPVGADEPPPPVSDVLLVVTHRQDPYTREEWQYGSAEEESSATGSDGSDGSSGTSDDSDNSSDSSSGRSGTVGERPDATGHYFNFFDCGFPFQDVEKLTLSGLDFNYRPDTVSLRRLEKLVFVGSIYTRVAMDPREWVNFPRLKQVSIRTLYDYQLPAIFEFMDSNPHVKMSAKIVLTTQRRSVHEECQQHRVVIDNDLMP